MAKVGERCQTYSRNGEAEGREMMPTLLVCYTIKPESSTNLGRSAVNKYKYSTRGYHPARITLGIRPILASTFTKPTSGTAQSSRFFRPSSASIVIGRPAKPAQLMTKRNMAAPTILEQRKCVFDISACLGSRSMHANKLTHSYY
jgi:hypothetical protein